MPDFIPKILSGVKPGDVLKEPFMIGLDIKADWTCIMAEPEVGVWLFECTIFGLAVASVEVKNENGQFITKVFPSEEIAS